MIITSILIANVMELSLTFGCTTKRCVALHVTSYFVDTLTSFLCAVLYPQSSNVQRDDRQRRGNKLLTVNAGFTLPNGSNESDRRVSVESILQESGRRNPLGL